MKDTQSPQISQKQDGLYIYICEMMKTMSPASYHLNGFITIMYLSR